MEHSRPKRNKCMSGDKRELRRDDGSSNNGKAREIPLPAGERVRVRGATATILQTEIG